jgi:carboxypeptidase Taq
MYEQNLKSSALTIDTPLSMGAHESQSLFWERHVGLSRPFWTFATPILKNEFENFVYTPQEVYEAVNAVTPGLIRVEADELTYPLHVILRYRLETSVIEGGIDVDDIPRVWKEEMKNLLNVEVRRARLFTRCSLVSLGLWLLSNLPDWSGDIGTA